MFIIDKFLSNRVSKKAESTSGIAVNNNSGIICQPIFSGCSFGDKADLGVVQATIVNAASESVAPMTSSSDVVNGQIDVIKDLQSSFKAVTALSELEKLKERCWADVDAHTKYRILTNIACAQMDLECDEEAGSNFVSAFSYNPTDEKSIANAILGYNILGNCEKAKELSEDALKTHPNSSLLATRRILIHIEDKAIVNPLSLVSKEHQDDANVCIAIASFYQKRGMTEEELEWSKIAYRNIDGDKSSISCINIKAFYATSLLSSIMKNEYISAMKLLKSEDIDGIKEVVLIYEEIWDKLKSAENVDKFLYIPFNLMTSYLMLAKEDEEEKLLNEIYALAPNAPAILMKMSAFLLSNRLIDKALSFLRKLPKNTFSEQSLMMAEALALKGMYEEALLEVEMSINKNQLLQENKKHAYIVKVNILKNMGKSDDAIYFLESLLKEKKITLSLYNFSMYFIANEKAYLQKACEEFSDNDSVDTKAKVADCLFHEGLQKEASVVYKKLFSGIYDVNNYYFKNYLISLVNSNQNKELESVLGSIKDEDKNDFIFVVMGIFCEKTGQLEMAKEFFDKSLTINPSNVDAFLRKCNSLSRLGNHRELKKFLDNLPSLDKASLVELEQLVKILKFYGHEQKAVNIAYESLSNNFSHVEAWNCYLSTMLLTKDYGEACSQIDVDTYFILENAMSKDCMPYMVSDDNFSENQLIKVIKTTDAFYLDVKGKNIGDVVVINRNNYLIRTIINKYVGLFQLLIENISRVFPEETRFHKFSFKDPNDILSLVRNSITQQKERAGNVFNYYRQMFPISTSGEFLGLLSLEMLNALESCSDWFVKTSLGTYEERSAGVSLLSLNSNGYIVDETTLYTVFKIGVEQEFLEILGNNVAVTQASIDVIRYMIAKNEMETSEKGGTIVLSPNDDGKFVFIDNKSKKTLLDEQNTCLIRMQHWIESSTNSVSVVPSIEKEPLNLERYELVSCLSHQDRSFILATWSSGRVSISNDWNLNFFLKKFFNIESTFLEAVLLKGVKEGIVSFDKYVKSIVYLLRNKYSFTSVNSDILLHLLNKSHNEISDDFLLVIEQIGLCTIDSALIVSFQFLKKVYNDSNFGVSQKTKICNEVFNSITKKCTHSRFDEIITKLIYLSKYLGLGYEKDLNNWLIGHFIDKNMYTF